MCWYLHNVRIMIFHLFNIAPKKIWVIIIKLNHFYNFKSMYCANNSVYAVISKYAL